MTLPALTFVLGGARSGKSGHALGLAESHTGNLTFIATATASDSEMADRIAQHQAERGERWRTVEAPVELPAAVRNLPADTAVCVVDCLTLWMTNLMMDERDTAAAARDLEAALSAQTVPMILVANEVGLGIVPDNALARRFRDEAGRLNQQIAAQADQVILMTAGIPLTLK